MMYYALMFGLGLLTGWWFIPQPQWAKDLYTKIFGNKTV